MIGEDALEQWLELFAPEATYRIVPRDNYDAGLPLALMDCATRDALIDRIASLRQANEFNIHTSRHVIGPPRVERTAKGVWRVDASFAVYQADVQGVGRLFAVGAFKDRVVETALGMRFADKLIILDTFNVPGMLSRPL